MQDEHSAGAADPGQPEIVNADTADATPTASLESLQASLAAAEAQIREHQENFLRAKAETENVRKRASQDLQQARKFALESFAAELLTVKDSLEAALAVQQSDLAGYRNGIEITLRQMSGVLEKFNIAEINPVGEKFDPHRHQAISAQESPEPPNTVLAVMQKGYALHERVLRPAFVTVAKSAGA